MGLSIPASEPKHRRHRQEGCEADDDGAESPAIAALYLYGDVLESVVERVPAPDLAAAAGVSREWLRAVRSALRRRPRRLPWLVVHLHGRRRRTAAYDPHSGAWLTVQAPRHATPSHVRLVRGARGDRVCALSCSGLDVAGDPLGTSACVAMKAPGVWRVDPVLAAVGDRVVALGGACQLALAEGEDAAAVEVHEGGNWTACDPMPPALRESAAATWLSVAATDHRVYLADRTSGCASWFDPSMRRWGPTRRLKPDAGVSTWGVAPGRAGAEQLVLFGAKREGEGAKNKVVIQAWEVDGDTLDLSPGAAHHAMPSEMSARLFPHDEDEEDDGETFPSIGVCGNATGGYVYNSAEPANGAVLYELQQEGTAGGAVERWEWVPCAPSVRAEPLGRVILACSPVGLNELELSRGLPPLGPQRACTDVQ
ncbi:F-box/kelch-repeat protein At1g23390 [Aegilops tauschii subsp. strangulata]|uniref:F-box domain-containing protein n=2 Tax=Aegilops tauschii TaxID=37682 RepID=A0A453F9W3_AEGTS|nr:F-box/kelch-repeat protein At1g23390 [Aegilops tauschii subsp. strangulata]